MTLGARGALYIHNGRAVVVPGVQTTVADTIGAGDTFSGARIDALARSGVAGTHARAALQRLDAAAVREVVDWATRAAAITVSRPGADPPRRGEVMSVGRHHLPAS